MDEKQGRLNALHQLLTNTDYKAIKYSEGLISDIDYEDIKAQRQAWRDEIREIEAQLADSSK